MLNVGWQDAIRRWADDYDQLSSNTPLMFLEPRGLPALETKLASARLTYATTGTFAAQRDGLRCVTPSQLAVDLLTGPGREPSQGEEMLAWMKDNEDVWRA
ncbi:MAG: hypothetical protein GY708_05370 [Actinomycetia bacterium]|nr:hypothetical protein [Actinomycetes bacterium]MCP4962718.1 hypothetical protein [Actinomycetes bacterium]